MKHDLLLAKKKRGKNLKWCWEPPNMTLYVKISQIWIIRFVIKTNYFKAIYLTNFNTYQIWKKKLYTLQIK
jgi:hypothetical protein